MTRWTLRAWLRVGLVAAIGAQPRAGAAQASIVIATGGEASVPIPTLMEPPHASIANTDIADQLFLRLAELGPTLMTSGDRAFEPRLARSWTRRDSVTLVFDLDPHATWHDGAPVTATDVVFTFARARDSLIAPVLSKLLRNITSVTEEGSRRVVFRYARPYAEQLYDAVFHVAPLPAHLLARLSPEALARSPFVGSPIGSGAYRWVKRVPGQYIELAANERFFLGAPAIRRVFFRLATDADARLNMVLGGEADAMDNIPPPRDNVARVTARKDLRVVTVPTLTVGFLLFNQRDPRDRARPHPILGDRDVRRAIGLALDRQLMVRATFGNSADVPYGPVSSMFWIRHGSPRPAGVNVREARRLLTTRGWTDHDGDGVLDRDGRPLALTLIVTVSSSIRQLLSQQVQEQLRQVGIRIEIQRMDFGVWNERHTAGQFDIDFAATTQDPSPTSLRQGWSCDGGTNVAKYCDPAVDSLLEVAGRTTERASEAWHAVLRRIEDDAPAVFMYAPNFLYVVHRRFGNVRIRPESAWMAVREWTVTGPEPRGTAGN
ncbi:MAG TPA: ABC transporter substrate-binding protein [Gemmatimonadales bacterium]|nr:ABC transporter substrate-binding protein [Gemmatimonadales bacterium]